MPIGEWGIDVENMIWPAYSTITKQCVSPEVLVKFVSSFSTMNKQQKGHIVKHSRRVQWLINLEITVLVRSLKSSNVELG